MVHQTWATKAEYVLTILGFTIGCGTFMKFPYMCMRNGGGAFVIPFILFSIIGAIPCVFLEMTIGQFSQSGPITVWNLCPPFKGVGVGTVLIPLIYSTIYPALFAWFIYYIYYSFSSVIPWDTCDNDWNTPSCIAYKAVVNASDTSNADNSTAFSIMNEVNATENTTIVRIGMTAAEEFWKFKVLEITDGLESTGVLRGALVVCLAITYVLLFFIMINGIKVSGKIVYVTVGLPYLLLTVFLIRGSLLPGAADGVYYYIRPDFTKLLNPRIWAEALSYALYSLCIGWSSIITMSGHNKFNNNCFRDAVFITLVDVFTTVYVGFAFFVVMGHVAYLRGVTVEAFESSGFNLAFIVYPQVTASLPLPQLWSALTFILLFSLGIDSMVPCFETVITALIDNFPALGRRRWLTNLVVLLPFFVSSLMYVSQGGIYVLTLVEWYAFFPSVVVFAMLECLVVSWIYGTKRMERDTMMMWGKKPPRLMNICLKFICPLLLLVLFCYTVYTYRPPKYGDYIYPSWVSGVGWLISFSSIIPLPIIFVWTVYKSQGDTLKEKLKTALQPAKTWRRSSEEDALNREDIEI